MSAPEHRGRQPQLYGGVAKFITWSVVFIIFIIAPLLSAFSVKPRMLSSGQDIEARVFAVFECRRVPCRNPWDTKRATAGSSGGAELCRILLVSQREINVLGERRPRHAISTARAHARCIDEADGHYFSRRPTCGQRSGQSCSISPSGLGRQ